MSPEIQQIILDLIDSLEYVDRAHPNVVTGVAVRQERIAAARSRLIGRSRRHVDPRIVSEIPFISAFAFVLRVNYFRGLAVLNPAGDGEFVGYHIWGWNKRTLVWDFLGQADDSTTANAMALAHQTQLRKYFDILPDAEVERYVLPDLLPQGQKALKQH